MGPSLKPKISVSTGPWRSWETELDLLKVVQIKFEAFLSLHNFSLRHKSQSFIEKWKIFSDIFWEATSGWMHDDVTESKLYQKP